MRIILFLGFLACVVQSATIQESKVSYEGFKVFRVELPTKSSYEVLSATPDIHFWREGRIGKKTFDFFPSKVHFL